MLPVAERCGVHKVALLIVLIGTLCTTAWGESFQASKSSHLLMLSEVTLPMTSWNASLHSGCLCLPWKHAQHLGSLDKRRWREHRMCSFSSFTAVVHDWCSPELTKSVRCSSTCTCPSHTAWWTRASMIWADACCRHTSWLQLWRRMGQPHRRSAEYECRCFQQKSRKFSCAAKHQLASRVAKIQQGRPGKWSDWGLWSPLGTLCHGCASWDRPLSGWP